MNLKYTSHTKYLPKLKLLVYLGISFIIGSCTQIHSKIETDVEYNASNEIPECRSSLVPFIPLNSQETTNSTEQRKQNRVVLLIPGLNNSIAAMAPLATALHSRMFHVEQLELPGQGTGVCRSQHIKELWRASVKDAMNTIARKHPTAKIYMIGYSLGGSLVTDYIVKNSGRLQPSKVVLIAPAIKLTTKTSLVRLVAWLRILGLSLPSLAPKALQAHSSVPLNHYSATLELAETNSAIADTVLARQTDVLVLISSTDTLVSPVETERWVSSIGVEQWKFHKIANSNSCSQQDGHYLPFPQFIGETNFNEMNDKIIQFLRAGESDSR